MGAPWMDCPELDVSEKYCYISPIDFTPDVETFKFMINISNPIGYKQEYHDIRYADASKWNN